MMGATTRRRGVVAITAATTLLVAAGVAHALPMTARAGDSGPTVIPLTDPADGECPQADYVVVSPGAGSSPVFLVVPPGPAGCPPGLDLTIGVAPGVPAGEAVAEPLTAASCRAGTDLIDSQITALGETSGGEIVAGPPGGGNSACAGGDAAFTQLEGDVARLSQAVGGDEGIYYFFRHIDGGHVLVVAGATRVPALAGAYYMATGTPEGVFTLRAPGSPPAVYALEPSGTHGVSTVVCAFCSLG